MTEPLTARVLADALGCFWNAAIGEAHNRQSSVAMDAASVMAEGIAAIAARLNEHTDPTPAPEGYAPCPTCKQYSHSIGDGKLAEAFNHFQTLIGHPVRGAPMGDAFDAKTRDAAQVLMAAAEALTTLSDKNAKLVEAGNGLLERMSSTYTARNGRQMGIQGDDGEKCWIVHSDDIENLRHALSASPTPASVTEDEVARVAMAIEDERSQRLYGIPGNWSALYETQREDRLHAARAAILAMSSMTALCEHGHTDRKSLCNQCEANSIERDSRER